MRKIYATLSLLIICMNIMNYLGFSKKGAENKTKMKENDNYGFQFTDKYPRKEGVEKMRDSRKPRFMSSSFTSSAFTAPP